MHISIALAVGTISSLMFGCYPMHTGRRDLTKCYKQL